MKPKILILIDWFAPGYLAGGPIRSAVNFAFAMRAHYQVRVLTGDRDLGMEEAYDTVVVNQWSEYAPGIDVYYASPDQLKWNRVKQLITAEAADFVYLNSMYSQPFTIYPLLLAWSNRLTGKLVLAPRGMLHPGALQYKRLKKQLFLNLIKGLGLHKAVHFQATDEQEAKDIQQVFGSKTQISRAGNWPQTQQAAWVPLEKTAAPVRMVYVSRIVPQKNLDFLLGVLQERDDLSLQLDLIGPQEDAAYWALCQERIAQLPDSITVTALGPLPHAEIQARLSSYHFFVLATHSENFGHAIFEALQAGKPVLISDQTPWQNLEAQQVGWVCSLQDQTDFSRAFTAAVQMPPETYKQWSESAWTFAHQYLQNHQLHTDYQALFPIPEKVP